MSEQDNIQIVRRTFDYLNSRDLDSGDQYLATDVIVEAPGSNTRMNRDQGKRYTQSFVDAFPDLHFDIKDIVAQGDKVAVTWTAKGTHKSPLTMVNGGTLSPTNKTATVTGCSFYTLRNNKITRQEIYWDQVYFLTQLGVLSGQDIMSRSVR